MTTLIRREDPTDPDLIAWWEEEDLDDGVQLLVGVGEAVVFVSQGEALAEFPQGRHVVSAEASPALEAWLDNDDDSVEVAFVRTTPVGVAVAGAFTFGPDDDEVTFESSAQVRVTDASAFVALLNELGEDESLEDWLGDELAIHVQNLAPTLGIGLFDLTSGAYDVELVTQLTPTATEALAAWGVELLSFGDFTWDPGEAARARAKEEALARLK